MVLIGVSALLWLPAALAQEAEKEKPKGPQMDELSQKLVESWEKSRYHLGRLGVKKASCKAQFKMSRMGQETTVNFTYKWDGAKGEIEWENPQMGAMLSQQGRFQESFDEEFRLDSFKKSLGTAKCTAKATEEGSVITVEGKTKAGYKSLTFDKHGVLTQIAMEVEGQMGPQKISFKLSYTKVDGKYLRSGQEGEVETAMGRMAMSGKLTYAKVGDYQVKQKLATEISMGGTPMGAHSMTFSDWKFNDDVK
jgi:hypothetical protein